METLQMLANDPSPKTEEQLRALARYAVRTVAGLGAVDGSLALDEKSKESLFIKALAQIRFIYNNQQA